MSLARPLRKLSITVADLELLASAAMAHAEDLDDRATNLTDDYEPADRKRMHEEANTLYDKARWYLNEAATRKAGRI